MRLLSLIVSIILACVVATGCDSCTFGAEPYSDIIPAPTEAVDDRQPPSGVRLFLYPKQSQGLRNDFKILEKLISEREPVFSQESHHRGYAKINLFLELIVPSWAKHAASNWLIVNQEFVQDPSFLKLVDVVLCKTRRCMSLMKDYREKNSLDFRMHYIGFTSNFEIKDAPLDYDLFFHAAGKSPLKNTGAVLDTWSMNPQLPKIFVTCGGEGDFSCSGAHLKERPFAQYLPNIRLETNNLPMEEYLKVFDHAGVHVAPSSIEGFGHCINEGRSKGAIVITSDAPPMNELIVDTETGFLVDVHATHVFNEFSGEVAYGVKTQDLENVVKKVDALPVEEKIAIGERARDDFRLETELFQFRFNSILNSALNGIGSTNKRLSFDGRRDRFTIVGWENDFKAMAAAKALNELGYEAKLVGSNHIASQMASIISESENSSQTGRHFLIWWSWKEFQHDGNIDQLKDLISQSKISSKFVNILYNFDDPYCWLDPSNDMAGASSLFDYAFVTSKERLDDYKKHGASAHFIPPATDEETHFYDPKPKYKVDVSMVISDFYDPAKFPALVSREKIAKELCQTPGLTFALYGPEHLRAAAPRCYRGYADQKLNRQIFSSSKINIATHALDGAAYMSDRVPFILMSKGLMLIDPVEASQSIFKDGENCFVIDTSKKISEQVKQILSMPESQLRRVRANGKKLAVEKFSYSAWAKQIIETVGAL